MKRVAVITPDTLRYAEVRARLASVATRKEAELAEAAEEKGEADDEEERRMRWAQRLHARLHKASPPLRLLRGPRAGADRYRGSEEARGDDNGDGGERGRCTK